MARKFNDEHIAGIFTGFGLTCTDPMPEPNKTKDDNSSPTPQNTKEPVSEENEEIVPATLQKKKSRQKTDRVSFMCRISESNLMKIRLLSATSGKSLSDFIDSSLTEYLCNHESEYGNILSRVQ